MIHPKFRKLIPYIPTIFAALLVVAVSQTSCDKLITETITETVFDTTTGRACLNCHTDQKDSIIVIPKGQWENSAHASSRLIEATVHLNGGTYLTSTCGPECHSGNGYVRKVTPGAPFPNGQSSTIGCFSCHQPHTGAYGTWTLATLRGDTTIIGLKTTTGVSVDAEFGESNMCVRCHQATDIPIIQATDSLVLIDKLFGPHASPQANLIAGVGGYLFTPQLPINSHATVMTDTADGCLSCHFRPGTGYELGEHTFAMRSDANENIAGCNNSSCHDGTPPVIATFESAPRIDSIQILLDSLKGRLAALQIIDTTDHSGLSINADTSIVADLARILQNYLLVRLDGSHGVHNARYALRLLQESAAQLDSL